MIFKMTLWILSLIIIVFLNIWNNNINNNINTNQEIVTQEIKTPEIITEIKKENMINIKIWEKKFTATLGNSKTALEFKNILPLTLNMQDFNSNEKMYDLDNSLPKSLYKPWIINSWDLMLWQSNTLVLFYETFSSSYSYTKIWKIDDITWLKEALWRWNITINFYN